jgi:hypothetical protein
VTSTSSPALAPTNGSAVPSQIATDGEFVSPSRNISCEIDYQRGGLTDEVCCKTFQPPQSLIFSAGGSMKTCTGSDRVGIPSLDAPTLAYGTSTGIRPFPCVSGMVGITKTVSGRGFEISRS